MEIPVSEFFLEKLSLDQMNDIVVEQIKILGGIFYITSNSDEVINTSESELNTMINNMKLLIS